MTREAEIIENAIGYLQEQKVQISLNDFADPSDWYSSVEAAQDILREAQAELESD